MKHFTKYIWGIAEILLLMLGAFGAYAKSEFAQRLESFTKNSCWFCGVFEEIFNIINEIVSVTCEAMQSTFLAVLGIGLAFFLAFRVGKALLDITGETDTKMFPEIFMQSMKVGFAAILITNYIGFFDVVVSPLLQMAMGVGNTMTETQLIAYTEQAERIQDCAKGGVCPAIGTTPSSYTKTPICPEIEIAAQQDEKDRQAGSKNVFTETTKQGFLCYLKTGSSAMMTGIAVGATAVVGWANLSIWSMFNHLQLLVVGLEFIVVFFIMFIMFPLKLLDPIMKLAFISALMPLWFTLWTFKVTSKYATDKAWSMFVNVMANFVVISVLAVIAIAMMNNALGDKASRDWMFQELLRGRAPEDVFEGVGKSGFNFGFVGKATLMTAALGYLAIKLFSKSEALAKEFADGVSLGISDGATKLAARGGQLAGQGAMALNSAVDHGLSKAAEGTGVGAKLARGVQFAKGGLTAAAFGVPGLAVGAAAVAHRQWKKPDPTRTHSRTLSDAANESTFVQGARRLFGLRNTWRKDMHDSRNNDRIRLSEGQKNGRIAKQDGGAARYEGRSHVYTRFDKKENITGQMSGNKITLNGSEYTTDASGTVISGGNEQFDLASNTFTTTHNNAIFHVDAAGAVTKSVIDVATGRTTSVAATADEVRAAVEQANNMQQRAREVARFRQDAMDDIDEIENAALRGGINIW